MQVDRVWEEVERVRQPAVRTLSSDLGTAGAKCVGSVAAVQSAATVATTKVRVRTGVLKISEVDEVMAVTSREVLAVGKREVPLRDVRLSVRC